MKYVVCDLDGTLFNVEHRLHLLANCRNEEDYDRFHMEHINDVVYPNILGIINTYTAAFGYDIKFIFVTGRHEKFRESTVKQLNELVFSPEHYVLYMKSSYDLYTPEFITTVINDLKIKCDGLDNILFVLDDRPATVKLYREAGLTCLQARNSSGFIEDVKEDKCNNLTVVPA